jgi:hypothetical protein
VWQHYLKAWAVDDQVACSLRGRTFRSGTTSFAVEKDFYRLRELTAPDLVVVDELSIKRCAPELQALQRGWLPMFTAVFDLKRAYDATGENDPEVARAFDEAINNLEDDLHTSVEVSAIRQLDAIRAHDLSFLTSDEELVTFVRYLSVQYMRTAKIRARCVAAMNSHAIPGFDAARAWGLMSHIFATSIGASLYGDRNKLRVTLLVGGAGAELIAADQPVINLRGAAVTAGGPVEELELYYPVSPTAALLVEVDQPKREVAERVLC